MGEVTVGDIKAEFEQRVKAGEFIGVAQAPGAAGRAFTTPEMIELERDIVDMMRAGQHAQSAFRDVTRDRPGEGAPGSDRTPARRGLADPGEPRPDRRRWKGSRVPGKRRPSRPSVTRPSATATRSKGSRRPRARRRSWARPASRRRRCSGIWRAPRVCRPARSGSTCSTNRVWRARSRCTNSFTAWRPTDRVLLVGDVRQHQAVDAGRPYQQLQEAGMETARLDDIVRQKDPALKAVVEQLSRGEVGPAIQALNAQGRVHEIADREDRLAAIAREYLKQPDGTLVVSPDNQSRTEINQVIHRAMQRRGQVDRAEHRVRVLVARQDITGADRQWAERYDRGDVVRYTKGSKALGLEAGEYARVEHVNAQAESRHGPPRRRRARHLRPAPATRRHAVSRSHAGVREGRPRAVHGAGPGAPHRQSRARHDRADRRDVAICRSASMRAGRSRSRSRIIPISTTATRSRATAARGRRPTACSCTSTRTGPASSSSIGAWPTSPCLVVGTTRRSTPTTPPISRRP